MAPKGGGQKAKGGAAAKKPAARSRRKVAAAQDGTDEDFEPLDAGMGPLPPLTCTIRCRCKYRQHAVQSFVRNAAGPPPHLACISLRAAHEFTVTWWIHVPSS